VKSQVLINGIAEMDLLVENGKKYIFRTSLYQFYDNFDTITGIDIKPFDYEYEDGKLVIDHKHPLSIKKQHIYNL
jgi:hypothetical protein